MELLNTLICMKNRLELLFIFLAFLSLIGGLVFGVIASIQFLIPDFISFLPFYKTRPLHVSMVIGWIFLASIGGIYHFIPVIIQRSLYSLKIGFLHFYLFLITGLVIIICFLLGKFGGREYWEFPPILSIPIIISWIFFGWNYFKSIFQNSFKWPVYVWMWTTGIIFFLITFSESYFWMLPNVKVNIIKELTLQWKSYGALVGSWNMLVYGTALYLMEKIKGDVKIARSKIAFLSFFLGFINLLFGWAHHIYNVPTPIWIRYTSYFISMTELLFIAKIIWTWKASLNDYQKNSHILSYKFIISSDFWIFLNLILALVISVPAINLYTHGTHITVAHAMGSTIGINTTILLASCFYIINILTNAEYNSFKLKIIKSGIIGFNLCLVLFWLSLIVAGLLKGIGIVDENLTFSEVMLEIQPLLIVFSLSGFGLFLSLLMILFYPLQTLVKFIFLKSITD